VCAERELLRAGATHALNVFFSQMPEDGKAGREFPRPAHSRKLEMHNHRYLLPKIIVKIGVKVKIQIIRK